MDANYWKGGHVHTFYHHSETHPEPDEYAHRLSLKYSYIKYNCTVYLWLLVLDYLIVFTLNTAYTDVVSLKFCGLISYEIFTMVSYNVIKTHNWRALEAMKVKDGHIKIILAISCSDWELTDDNKVMYEV